MNRHAIFFVIISDLHVCIYTCWFDEVRVENDFPLEFHAIVELLCKALRIGTISLRNVRSLLIDFNKTTMAMTFFVCKSWNGKRDILRKKTWIKKKTIEEHISATYMASLSLEVTKSYLYVCWFSLEIYQMKCELLLIVVITILFLMEIIINLISFIIIIIINIIWIGNHY